MSSPSREGITSFGSPFLALSAGSDSFRQAFADVTTFRYELTSDLLGNSAEATLRVGGCSHQATLRLAPGRHQTIPRIVIGSILSSTVVTL